MDKKSSRDQALQQKSDWIDKHQGSHAGKILRTILKMNKGVSQTNVPKNSKVDVYAKVLTSEW